MSIFGGIASIFVLILIPVSVIYSRFLGHGIERKQPQSFFYFKQSSNHLPFVLLITSITLFFLIGWSGIAEEWIPVCLSIFITMGIYNLILMALLPVIRKHFSSTLITSLWVAPNILYIFLFMRNDVNPPLFVLYIPRVVYWIILGIWFVGFVVLFSARIISHLRFRSKIEKTRIPEGEEQILELWEKIKGNVSKLPENLSLYRSPEVQSPLSIGMVNPFVVLPEMDYTLEELTWIFLHELTHISRRDCATKMYIAFCNALFWFFPPAWRLLAKVSEDLELSCDEIVLLQNPDSDPKKYASLILDTSACATGFTTCLSASGECISYRMKQILHPMKQKIVAETIIVMLACVCILFSCGRIQISNQADTLVNLIFAGEISDLNQLTEANMDEISENTDVSTADVVKYLNTEEGYKITGTQSFADENKSLSFDLNGRIYSLEFSNHQLCVREFDSDWNKTEHYYYLKTNRWKEVIP